MQENDAVVLYTPPSMGHIVSTTELAKLIQRHCPNLSITIIYGTDPNEPPTTYSVHTNLISSNSAISFLHLPPPPSTSTSTSAATRTISPAAVAFDSIRRNAPDVLSALRQISSKSRIRAFVIDLFCSTALPIASSLHIPTYYFFTSGAAALAAYLHMPTVDKRVLLPPRSFRNSPDLTVVIPGLPPIPAPHMPEPLLDRDDPAYGEMLYFCSCLAKSKGIIVNTFDELEPVAMSAILEGLCVPESPTPPVFNIGPLISVRGETDAYISRNECLSWLDSQPSNSVVFLCFGSRGLFSFAQTQEIAKGLEMSGKRFLWVVRNPPTTGESNTGGEESDLERLLPGGFLERTKDKGMVVKKWAPQTEILKHGSVAAFVTHCGWNSVLEAVVAGKPMVAWPLYAEQHLNRAVLVKDMKMAVTVEVEVEVEVEEGRDGDHRDGFVSGPELASRIKELLESEKGREIREKASVMREKALVALRKRGSSIIALEKLVSLWCQDS